MEKKIKIRIGGKEINASLNDSDTAADFYDLLPLTISMQRWGDEYYGDCGLKADTAEDARADMEIGELAIWPGGNALCIFFGPTPVSISENPRAISPVNPIGRAEQPVDWLKKLGGSIDIEVEKRSTR
jgi:hypothetical protein